MIKLTGEILRQCMPRCQSPDLWAAELQVAMDRFEISANKERVSRFLAQIAVESAELTRLDENLNYSADRLMQVWPKRFPTREIAAKYANAPQKLANYVYANRMGNGDEASGDGWKYRGRGPKMVTGAENYRLLGVRLGDPLLLSCPDRLLTKSVGAAAAAFYWHVNNLNQLADDLPDDDQDGDYVTITRRINGGTIGLDARKKYLERIEKVFA